MLEEQPITTENHNWSCPPQGIIRKKIIKRFERWVQVGEANMAYGDYNATFSYGRSADSSINTGFSVDGGLFHISGTRHIGNTEGAAVGMSTAGANQLQVLSRFVYKEGRGRSCDSRHHHYQTFGLAAVRWVKAVSKDHQHDTLNRCPVNSRTAFPKNASFSRTHNHFERFHRGVSMGPSYRGWGISFGEAQRVGPRPRRPCTCGSGISTTATSPAGSTATPCSTASGPTAVKRREAQRARAGGGPRQSPPAAAAAVTKRAPP